VDMFVPVLLLAWFLNKYITLKIFQRMKKK
jgi:hypothetical protein